MRLDENISALKLKVDDQFAEWAIEGARRALTDTENPLRLNFFSTGMRILFEHLMGKLSPEDEVAKSSWFKSERDDSEPKPTRGQRVTFAIQGGLSDSFVKDELKVDLLPLRKRL